MSLKANRLVTCGAVSEIEARSFEVRGDHATYLVTVASTPSGIRYACSCPARTPECSHALAAAYVVVGEPARAPRVAA